MATGPEALAALQAAASALPKGSEHWIDIPQKIDLSKLRYSDLTAAGFAELVAKEIIARLGQQDVSGLGQALGLSLRIKFKLWADRSDGGLASVRCEGEKNAWWLRNYLGQELPGLSATDPKRFEESSIWGFQVHFDEHCTPYLLREVLESCPAAMPLRLFPVSVKEQPHYLIQPFNLASWIEDQGQEVWWTADGDPTLMSRLEFPAPPDELAVALREIHRPLLVADPQKSGSGEELAADEVDQVLDADEWGNRRLFLRWEDSPVDWILVEDEPTSESRSGV